MLCLPLPQLNVQALVQDQTLLIKWPHKGSAHTLESDCIVQHVPQGLI